MSKSRRSSGSAGWLTRKRRRPSKSGRSSLSLRKFAKGKTERGRSSSEDSKRCSARLLRKEQARDRAHNTWHLSHPMEVQHLIGTRDLNNKRELPDHPWVESMRDPQDQYKKSKVNMKKTWTKRLRLISN